MLQLYGEDVHLYQDAVSGRDVVECQSAVCTTQPCRNGAVCTQHEDSGSWFCNCPPGFTGTLCERPVCATNPCKYGGTCLGSKAGPGFLCLCPVGRGGALCEDGNQKLYLSSKNEKIILHYSVYKIYYKFFFFDKQKSPSTSQHLHHRLEAIRLIWHIRLIPKTWSPDLKPNFISHHHQEIKQPYYFSLDRRDCMSMGQIMSRSVM